MTKLKERGTLHALRKLKNWYVIGYCGNVRHNIMQYYATQYYAIRLFSYICRTDPEDVARVESKTFICTKDKHMTVPHVKEGSKGILGQWISPQDLNHEVADRMKGIIMDRLTQYCHEMIGCGLAMSSTKTSE